MRDIFKVTLMLLLHMSANDKHTFTRSHVWSYMWRFLHTWAHVHMKIWGKCWVYFLITFHLTHWGRLSKKKCSLPFRWCDQLACSKDSPSLPSEFWNYRNLLCSLGICVNCGGSSSNAQACMAHSTFPSEPWHQTWIWDFHKAKCHVIVFGLPK